MTKKPQDGEIRESHSIGIEPLEKWPSRIEVWCYICTKLQVASKKKPNGEFDEQQFCQHVTLKRVVK